MWGVGCGVWVVGCGWRMPERIQRPAVHCIPVIFSSSHKNPEKLSPRKNEGSKVRREKR